MPFVRRGYPDRLLPDGLPAHTYSIVARDPVTGHLGVAVQSHYFGVGAVVPWAEPGVGVVAIQSFLNVGYGPEDGSGGGSDGPPHGNDAGGRAAG